MKEEKKNQSSTSHTCHNEHSQCRQSERWTSQGLEQSLIKGPGAGRWQLTSLTPSSPTKAAPESLQGLHDSNVNRAAELLLNNQHQHGQGTWMLLQS